MIRVIGAGPGHVKYLTQEAYEIISTSENLAAFGRISKSVEKINGKVIRIQKVEEILEMINQKDDIDILASGDPCFFGVVDYLKKSGVTIDEVIPGLSSFQYMMAKLKKNWQEACFISLHGRKGSLDEVLSSKLCVILTDQEHSPGDISRKLYLMGISGLIYAGFDLSYPEEKIIEKKIGEDIPDYSGLSVVVVEHAVD
ncbi:MAG: precorrin-6y C5,15-methyltransferase (decarboxylating) subunit CbiE [Firmicutes bacterium]|nr:precorrin-6y C5,15-methyltransferase (decarboxylating) subunit CbiE [Bacillota bacterium]